MFTQMPTNTTNTPVVNGNQLEFNPQFQNREVPESQKEFITKLGWKTAGYHPDTQEELYRKPPPDNATSEVIAAWDYELGSGYWHWYEAVAYEFSKFINIGDD